MKQAYVDANVILRLVTGDPPDMAEKAASVFRQAEDGRLQLVIDAIVLAECVWVLSSFYGFVPADIAPILRMLLSRGGLHTTGPPPIS
jgi:predicted nucleic acid-binding protein